MKYVLLFLMAVLVAAAPAAAPHWTGAQLDRLGEWVDASADDALGPVAAERSVLDRARTAGDGAALDETATRVALHLLDAHRHGCCERTSRDDWHIASDAAAGDPAVALAAALAHDGLDHLFANARPFHPHYLALRHAYARETDAARRATLAANLDRWRWMPRRLGNRYLIVNSAAFEATLWDGGRAVGRWQVVVGKLRSPTPIFATTVNGVIFNPYWEIPASIVQESVGALLRERPVEAARKGYVIEGERYRQRPGPQNALGRMKLVMPNPYNVYLHDTPAQALFERDVRAFSHGCVRVGDAMGLATALLKGKAGWARAQVDGAVAAGKTITVPLDRPLPVYIAYFTAEPDDEGGIRYFPDIYGRDRVPGGTSEDSLCKR